MAIEAELNRRDEDDDLVAWKLTNDADNTATGKSDPVIEYGVRSRLDTIVAILQDLPDLGDPVALDTATLAALENITATISGTVPVSGPLTDAQLRASAVPVTDAGLGAKLDSILTELGQKLEAGGEVALSAASLAALETITATISGSVAVTGPLTDAELRATPVPVSGTVTVNEPVSVDDNGGSLTVDGTVTVQDGGGSITVDATNLDVRDLAFGTDKVDVSNSDDLALVSGALGSDGELSGATLVNVVGGDPLLLMVSPHLHDGIGGFTRARGDTANGMDVDVTRLPPLPAGTNNIGDVDVASIATGTNHIGTVQTKPTNGVIRDNSGDDCTVKSAVVDSNATNGDFTIVAAVASKKIRVLSFSVCVNASAALNFKFRSGTGGSTIAGTYSILGQTTVAETSADSAFLFETASGAALVGNVAATTARSVRVTYAEVD